jgi:hypothetical protein
MRSQQHKSKIASCRLFAGAACLLAASGAAAPESLIIHESGVSQFIAAAPRCGAGHSRTRAAATLSRWDTDMMPIRLSLSVEIMFAGESATIGVSVSSVPPDGGAVQILCDAPEALSSPTGAWPAQICYPAGASLTQSIGVTANYVLLPTIVTLYTGDSNADPNNPSDWTAAGTILILPGL